MRAGSLPRAVEVDRKPLVQRVGDQRALSGARDTRDRDENAEREYPHRRSADYFPLLPANLQELAVSRPA